MVKLTKIYTRTGDEGMTGLSDFSRARKTDPRIEAYADVDEANSAIGVAVALAKDEFDKDTLDLLMRIQNDLFDLGADLCRPDLAGDATAEYPPLRIIDAQVDRLEMRQALDHWKAEGVDLSRILLAVAEPGAGLAGAL